MKVIVLGENQEAIDKISGTSLKPDCVVVTVGFTWRQFRRWDHLIFLEDFPKTRIAKFKKLKPVQQVHDLEDIKKAMKYGAPGPVWPDTDNKFGNSYFFRAAFWSLLNLDPDVIAFTGFDNQDETLLNVVKQRAKEERCKLVTFDELNDLEKVKLANY
jgi:hypothetical protein